ncbi:unnamed protein product [Symbiodinium sp. CCMP2592]|nr:unnamed protein product [Symbiodinium sp. CCMP2592]
MAGLEPHSLEEEYQPSEFALSEPIDREPEDSWDVCSVPSGVSVTSRAKEAASSSLGLKGESAPTTTPQQRALALGASLLTLGDPVPSFAWESGFWESFFNDKPAVDRMVPALKFHRPSFAGSIEEPTPPQAEVQASVKRPRKEGPSSFLEVVKNRRVISWRDKREAEHRRALCKWSCIFDKLDCESDPVIKTIASLSETEKFNTLDDYMARKAPSTMTKRANSILKIIKVGEAKGLMFPVSEPQLYELLQEAKTGGALPSQLRGVMEGLLFARHVFNIEAFSQIAISRRCWGVGASRLAKTPSKAAPLRVIDLAALHQVLDSSSNPWDRLFAGCALFCVYSRSRWSDAQHVDSFKFDKGSDNQKVHYLEAVIDIHKNMNRRGRSPVPLELVAPGLGVSSEGWIEKFLDARSALGLSAEHAFMPAPDARGVPTIRALDSDECGDWLLRLLPAREGLKTTSHSLKRTLLSYCAKWGISHDDRLAMGGHSHPGRMSDEYADDAMARPLRLIEMAAHEPPRAGSSAESMPLLKQSLVADEMPVAEESGSGRSTDSSSSDSSSSNSSASVPEPTVRPVRLLPPPAPADGCRFVQHARFKTLHLQRLRHVNMTLCGRIVKPPIGEPGILRYDTPVCRACKKEKSASSESGKQVWMSCCRFATLWKEPRELFDRIFASLFRWKLEADTESVRIFCREQAMALVDSHASFRSRCVEICGGDEMYRKLAGKEIKSFSDLAFACGTPQAPPSVDEFRAFSEDVLGLGASLGETSKLTRLHFEAATYVVAQLKQQVARYREQRIRLSGLVIQGELLPSHALVDAVAHMSETNCLTWLAPSKCTKRDQELKVGPKEKSRVLTVLDNSVTVTAQPDKLIAEHSTPLQLQWCMQRRGLAFDMNRIISWETHEKWVCYLLQCLTSDSIPGYSPVTVAQVVKADSEMFLLMSKEIKNVKASATGEMEADTLLDRLRTDPRITMHLLPLPKALSSLATDSVIDGSLDGDKNPKKKPRRERRTSALTGAVKVDNMPKELKDCKFYTDQSGRRLCWTHNTGTCNAATDGGHPPACKRGVHACMGCRKAGHGWSACWFNKTNGKGKGGKGGGKGSGKADGKIDKESRSPKRVRASDQLLLSSEVSEEPALQHRDSSVCSARAFAADPAHTISEPDRLSFSFTPLEVSDFGQHPAEEFARNCLQQGSGDSSSWVKLAELLPDEESTRETAKDPLEKCFITGAYNQGGITGVRRRCREFPACTRLLVALARLAFPGLNFTSVGLFRNMQTALHKDANNLPGSRNGICALSFFEGGQLRLHRPDGPVDLSLSEGPLQFDPFLEHETLPWSNGFRIVLVAFSVNRLERLTPEHRAMLTAFDIPLPLSKEQLEPASQFSQDQSKPISQCPQDDGEAGMFLELFAGTARLSQAFTRLGFQALAFDKVCKSSHPVQALDFADRSECEVVLQLIQDHASSLQYVHMAPPQETCLAARNKEEDQPICKVCGFMSDSTFDDLCEVLWIGIPRTPSDFVQQAVLAGHPKRILEAQIDERTKLLVDNLLNGRAAHEDLGKSRLAEWSKIAKELEPVEEQARKSLDPLVSKILGGKRTFLLERLLADSSFPDQSLVPDLRKGFPLTGWMPRNAATLARVSSQAVDAVAEKAWSETLEEQQKGWLFEDPDPDLSSILLARRFGIVQGAKTRVIDDGKAAGINQTVGLPERFRLHNIDFISAFLVWAMMDPRAKGKQVSGKTIDLKWAYKQYAVDPSDREIFRIIVLDTCSRKPKFFGAAALPFGTTGSVAGFLRTSAATWHIGSALLGLSWCNYFDDFPLFSLDEHCPCAESCAEALLDILGITFAREGKKATEFSKQCRALGLIIDLSEFGQGVVYIKHTPERIQELRQTLTHILESGLLESSEAEALRGRLHWFSSFLFGRRPCQALRVLGLRAKGLDRGKKLSSDLRDALTYLRDRALESPPVQLTPDIKETFYVFTDGSLEGDVAGVGGILYDPLGKPLSFFAASLPIDALNRLKETSSHPIYEVELLAIWAALKLWMSRLTRCLVVIYLDNEAAKGALVSGKSSTLPGQSIVSSVLDLEDSARIRPWYGRVPTSSNPADETSTTGLHVSSANAIGFLTYILRACVQRKLVVALHHECFSMANLSKSLKEFADDVPVQRTRSGTSQLFKMYVVPAEILVQMSEMKDHEALIAEEILVVFDESMGQAMFVSHQWAGIGHPDPSMKQFRVLQDALKGFLHGRADVPASLSIELYLGDGTKITGAEIASKPLFIWYDYFCCPQASDQTEHRRKAIISIPYYIENCRYFAILCPHVRHEEHDTLLNKHTWAERGWCRLEQVCKEFSIQDASCDSIDIQSSIFQTRAPSYNWIKQPVGEGFFTVDADRQRIAPVLRDMVSTKMTSYLLKAKFHDYRLLLNLQPVHFRGLPLNPIDDLIPGCQSDEQDPAAFILAQFMHQNGFVSYTEHTSEGWAPISYAALSGNPMLISALLEQKADPNECTAMPDSPCQFAAKTPCLVICAFLKHNHALRMLLAFNADLTAKDGYGATALHWAAAGNNAEGIQILRRAGCDCAVQVPNMLGYSPFAMACAGGGLEAIKELLSAVSQKELTCGLHAALLQGGGSAAVVAELIQAGADVNGQLSVPLLSPFGVIFAYLSLRHLFCRTHLSAYAYHHHRASPLMCSLLSSSFDAAAVLLAAGARCDLENSRGYTALDLAKETSAPEFITAALSGQPTACEALVKEHLHKVWIST